ncbi:MAG: type II secretion system protein [Candidatus Omnitrophica bacterium]|nr:hypothetical protein [bacterium]NUN95889.1 type II secretion system protein [Candidatus Omnitrophota bacterium]
MLRKRAGFTLVETLVVLTIILIVSAIAMPQYWSLREKAMVTQARANVRQTVQALDLYAADFRAYPATAPVFPEDPLALLSHSQLRRLTTPVAYLSPAALADPFGLILPQPGGPATSSNDFPELTVPNAQRSLLYYDYPSLAIRRRLPILSRFGASVVSIGPDTRDSYGVYRPFGPDFFAAFLPSPRLRHPYDTVYNPTNGTGSAGDISGFAGEASHFSAP